MSLIPESEIVTEEGTKKNCGWDLPTSLDFGEITSPVSYYIVEVVVPIRAQIVSTIAGVDFDPAILNPGHNSVKIRVHDVFSDSILLGYAEIVEPQGSHLIPISGWVRSFTATTANSVIVIGQNDPRCEAISEEARKAEEARRAEEMCRVEKALKPAEEAHKAEEAHEAAVEAHIAEEARKAEKARKAEVRRITLAIGIVLLIALVYLVILFVPHEGDNVVPNAPSPEPGISPSPLPPSPEPNISPSPLPPSPEPSVSPSPLTAKELFRNGFDYFKQNDIPNAIEAYKRAISFKHNFADAWYNLGGCYAMEDDAANADDAMIHLERLDPGRAKDLIRSWNADFVQRIAVSRYPSLAVIDTPLNLEFRRRCDYYRANRPSYFGYSDWALSLAKESVKAVRNNSNLLSRQAHNAILADKAKIAQLQKQLTQLEKEGDDLLTKITSESINAMGHYDRIKRHDKLDAQCRELGDQIDSLHSEIERLSGSE